MGLIHDFFRAYVEMMEDAGFIVRIIIFVISCSVVGGLLFTMVVFLILGMCNWWSGAGAGAATVAPAAPEEPDAAAVEPAVVEEPAAVPVGEVAELLDGGEQAARAIRRRRAARDSALSEPGSSSGSARELERE